MRVPAAHTVLVLVSVLGTDRTTGKPGLWDDGMAGGGGTRGRSRRSPTVPHHLLPDR